MLYIVSSRFKSYSIKSLFTLYDFNFAKKMNKYSEIKLLKKIIWRLNIPIPPQDIG